MVAPAVIENPINDTRAATFTVNPTGDHADFTDLAAAIAALPAGGGTIYFDGVFPLTAALAPPDKPIKFLGSGKGAAILDLGANAIAAFSLAFNNRYTFQDFTIRGTALAGQIGFSWTGGLVSPKTNRCLRVRTEAVERVVDVPAGNLAFFSFISCSLQNCTLGTARIISGESRIFAYDTGMGNEAGNNGGFSGNVEAQFVRCEINLFNGGTLGGQGGNPCLIGCKFTGGGLTLSGISGYRIKGCAFAPPAGPALIITSDGHVVIGNTFSLPPVATAISITSRGNVVVGNLSGKIVESGAADGNRYADNTGFDGVSTIIGPTSLVGNQQVRAVSTTPYTVIAADRTLVVDAVGGAITINLPTAALAKWQILNIKKIDASVNIVTIDGAGAETIDGAATLLIALQYQSRTIQSDGVQWWII